MNKIILTDEFRDNSKIFIDTALYIAVSKDRDDFAIYDGEAIKCLGEFAELLGQEFSGKYENTHPINSCISSLKDSLQKAIDSKIDRKNYTKILQDNLSDFFETIVICFSRGFKAKYLEVIPVLTNEEKIKYYYYDIDNDKYVEKDEVPYMND